MIDLPDIDEFVALEAVLHMQPAFTTMDLVDWLRAQRPDKRLARRSNPEIGRFLSARRSMLLITSEGSGGGVRGHRWHRTLAGNAAAMLLWLFERGYHAQVLQLLRRLRPLQAAEYEHLATQLPATFKGRSWPRRTQARRADPIDDPTGLRWDDPRLLVKGDGRLRAEYRLLQSWYRDVHLKVPAGRNADGRLVGSMIDLDTSIANPGLNFLNQAIADYVDARLPEIQATGGTVDPDRLRRNMLSSQPLCFNLFGGLRTELGPASAVLADVLELDIAVIEEITVEYAPLPASRYLSDRTAFDAFIAYRTQAGDRAFVGVETKYTEPFSPKVYTAAMNANYGRWTATEFGFAEKAARALEDKSVNQLWRNAMLTVATRHVDGFESGHVAVIGCERDTGIDKAVKALTAQLNSPKDLVRTTSLEMLIKRAAQEKPLAAWAEAFRIRYLDLAPTMA